MLGCEFCFIPSPLKIAELRQKMKDRKSGHRLSATSNLLHHQKKENDSLHFDDHFHDDYHQRSE